MPNGGDSIGSGFVYNGKTIPALRGKYIFTDLTTGRIWYADYKDMLAADDGKPGTMAAIHEVKLLWNREVLRLDVPDRRSGVSRARRQEPAPAGTSRSSSRQGRADVRFSIDADGELYLYSKGDGIIRAVVEAIGF